MVVAEAAGGRTGWRPARRGGVTSLYSDNRQSGAAMRLAYGQPVLEPVKLRAGHAIARSAVGLSISSCALAASTTAMSLI